MSNKKDLARGLETTLLGESRDQKSRDQKSRLQELEAELGPKAREVAAASRASEKKGPGRPKKEFVDDTFFRTTIIAHRVNYEKLKVIAMKEGRPFKDVLNDALFAVIEKYEEKNGEVIVRDNHENPFK